MDSSPIGYSLAVKIEDDFLLWFKASNTYLVVSKPLKERIDCVICGDDSTMFYNDDVRDEYQTISNLLNSCQTGDSENSYNVPTTVSIQIEGLHHFKLDFGSISVALHLDSHAETMLLPYMENYLRDFNESVDYTYHIFRDGDHLLIFKDKRCLITIPFSEPHRVIGKFNFYLLCDIHAKSESDWTATLHGSTIMKGNQALLLVGDSGSGKTTLSALLCAHGYTLLADDISPLSAAEQKIYWNPNSSAIKTGAVDVLRSFYPDLSTKESFYMGKEKGNVRYLNAPTPRYKDVNVNHVISVKYQKDAKAQLSPIPISQVLNFLIPESWIQPSQEHANQFMTWVAQLKTYELVYSSFDSALSYVNALWKDTHD